MIEKKKLTPEQDFAADPSKNIWVQANAGTGKTSVLTERLLRILFRSNNIENTGILCLTYTNAAAGEMRNRILKSLREWALASDDDLKILLAGISKNKTISNDDIVRARGVFFTYIDNPDLLKIKTIHGFCEEILHRFPIEAGLSPAWSLVSDTAQHLLMRDAFECMIHSATDPKVGDAFARIVNRISEYSVDDLLDILGGQYSKIFMINDIDKYREYFVEKIKDFLNLNTGYVPDKSGVIPGKILQMTLDAINGQKNDKKTLNDIVKTTKQYIEKTIDFEEYAALYVTEKGTLKTRGFTGCDFLLQEGQRVYEILEYETNVDILKDTVALFDLAVAFTKKYLNIKHEKNVLDFEDLILYTWRLFSEPETMGWILSQLDVSLNHILVDEAQDTSPMQWNILRLLVGDFFTDGQTTENVRSLFVVGDSKQSIYAFMGADAKEFAASRDSIKKQIEQNLREIHNVSLAQSFRSLSSILYVVDMFFDNGYVIEQTDFENNKHVVMRKKDGPGLVEIHKLVSKKDTGIDRLGYVKQIVNKIKDVIDSGVQPKDIMVLLQKRKPFAAPLISELKKCNIDVAGSDRIVLPDFPAIRDMMNLVRFCLNPDDDYRLCCVLKSPLYRLSERDIYNICSMRNQINSWRLVEDGIKEKTSVFETLKDMRSDIYSDLCLIKTWADSMGPYSFFSNVLRNNNMRQKMISALGTQIIDPLEEFMTICLAYERTQTGTLKYFLKWFVTGKSEIKRDMDSSSGVRVVTVHGSKGLEAPVVFLVDTVGTPETEKILPIPIKKHQIYPTPWLWIAHKTSVSGPYTIAKDCFDSVRIAEYYRLLYVAMTRARNELYIYGFTQNTTISEISWHAMLWNILNGLPNIEKKQDTIRIIHE